MGKILKDPPCRIKSPVLKFDVFPERVIRKISHFYLKRLLCLVVGDHSKEVGQLSAITSKGYQKIFLQYDLPASGRFRFNYDGKEGGA